MEFKSEAWKNASDGDKMRRLIIEEACKNHQKLIAFLFKGDSPEMWTGPEMWENSGALSSGERAIVGFCISVWFDTSHANLCDILHRLDQSNFNNFGRALGIWRSYKADGIKAARMTYDLLSAIETRPL